MVITSDPIEETFITSMIDIMSIIYQLPPDSTKSYIKGGDSLESVTVLVGVHHAGVPIVG